MKDIRLAICIPSGGSWSADFGMHLVFLTNYLAAHGIIEGKTVQYYIQNKRGSILANMREWMVQAAIKQKATHILFLDSDQTFPRDLVHRLMKHGKQVVACNVATKMLPPSSTARLKGGLHGVPLFTKEHDTDLVPVWRVGTGVMLINLNIFKREGMEAPWFNQRWNPELNGYVGEDWAFCEKLEASGVKIYVDQDVSREIGHVGSLTYDHSMVDEAYLNASSDS